MKKLVLTAAIGGMAALAAVGWVAARDKAGKSGSAQTQSMPTGKARAAIEGRSGSALTGSADFLMHGDAMMITVKVEGAPAGLHAVHVHEKGDCSAPDATSAGAHFNPGGHQHGAPDAAEHHAGDFGNIKVGEDGTGTLTIHAKGLSIAGQPDSVVGRALIIHEKPDDFVTQPTGAAGGRIGCGVIEAAM